MALCSAAVFTAADCVPIIADKTRIVYFSAEKIV